MHQGSLPFGTSPPDEQMKQLRVICGALTGGVIVFAGIALAVLSGAGPLLASQGQVDPLLRILFGLLPLALTVVDLIAMQIAYARMVAGAARGAVADRPAEETDRVLTAQYCQSVIIRFALLEGPALFSCIAIMLVGEYGLLALVGCLVVAQMVVFPTEQRRLGFVEAVIARAQRDLGE